MVGLRTFSLKRAHNKEVVKITKKAKMRVRTDEDVRNYLAHGSSQKGEGVKAYILYIVLYTMSIS